MPKVKALTSTANPRLKAVAALALKKERKETGLFLAEGLQTLTYALQAGWQPQTLLHTAEENHPLLAPLAAAARYVYTVPPHLLTKLTHRENAQSVLATFQQQWHALAQAKAQQGDLWLALDRVRDPGNLGTILRTSDATGVTGVILIDDCTDPYAPDCVRATMGSLFHVPLYAATTDEFLAWQGSFPGSTFATHLQGAVDFRELNLKPSEPKILLMGNEQQGLPEVLAKAATTRVKIPMLGKLESLNLAIATGLMLYELRRSSL